MTSPSEAIAKHPSLYLRVALKANGIDPDPEKWKGQAGVFFAKVREALER